MSHHETPVTAVDEVIVGAGLTGLVYGCVAARDRRVVVLEKHIKPGGYATNFKRHDDAYVFDCSMHRITGMGDQDNLADALRRAGLLSRIAFHECDHQMTFVIGHRRLRLSGGAGGRTLAHEELKSLFPNEATALDRFFADVTSCGLQSYMMGRIALGEFAIDPDVFVRSRQLSRMTMRDYLAGLFKDRCLFVLLASLSTDFGSDPDETDALYYLHFVYAFLVTRNCYVKGSSQYLSDTLADELQRRGGQLLCSERVKCIDTHDGGVSRVHTRRRVFETQRVVFTGCPHHATELLPPGDARDTFARKLEKLSFSLGTFVVYLGLSAPPHALGITDSDYLVVPPDYLDDAAALRGPNRHAARPMAISNYPMLDPAYGNTLQLGITEPGEEWLALPRAEYKASKKRVAQILIDRACAQFPALRQAIRYVDASTPRTNRKYTNSGGGSAFGYTPAPRRNISMLHAPPLRGLEFVGTWVNGPGYETAMGIGFAAATLHQRRLDALACPTQSQEKRHAC
ncbi:MAG: NAD(P)/FAD-dependent oxidoreductase [Cupriavidus sp.]|nr:NAD(P)/FAD-dependent oxidoreductase [Cupriavidus sp.]